MRFRDGPIAVSGLIFFTAWLLIGLPWLLTPSEHVQYQDNAQGAPQPSNVKSDFSAQVPLIVQVVPGPKSAQERTQEAEDRQEKRDSDRWLVRWTAALFAATVGLILATVALRYFAWRQMHDMKGSVAAAQKAADAAKESAGHLRNAERPYITPCEPILRNYRNVRMGARANLCVDFGLENIAKGTGFVLAYGIAHEICDNGKHGSQELTVRDEMARLPLGPGSKWSSNASFDIFRINDLERTAILECTKTLYVYGYIRYLDLFGIIRRTGFAFELIDHADNEALDNVDRLAISVTNPALWYDHEETDQRAG